MRFVRSRSELFVRTRSGAAASRCRGVSSWAAHSSESALSLGRDCETGEIAGQKRVDLPNRKVGRSKFGRSTVGSSGWR